MWDVTLASSGRSLWFFLSRYLLSKRGRSLACPTFQQFMRPATFSFLSIVDLARVKSKSPKDMSHAARLVLRPIALIRDPNCTVAFGFSQIEQPK
ncbi:hypothetical protein ACFXTH_034546 [Malus domestica]